MSKQNVSQLEIKLENLTSQLKEANNRAESLEKQLDSTTNQLQQIQESMLAAKNNNAPDPKLGEELRDTMKRNEAVSKLDGLIVRLEGFLTYDDVQGEINLSTRNGVKIPIRQDEFAGALVGICGLPISDNMEERCLVNIEAELLGQSGRIELVGREIIDIAE